MSPKFVLKEINWSPRTLVWHNDDLVDVTQAQRASVDGRVTRAQFYTPYPFDAAVAIAQGDSLWSVTYERNGTKAILFKNEEFQRELNRSYYHAKAYEYPIALAIHSSGDPLLIHCPNRFDTLEIEHAASGALLGRSKSRFMEFHSRLSVSPNQRFVIDAGWFWHPWSGIWVFDLFDAVRDSAGFGDRAVFSDGQNVDVFEVDSACFLDSDRIAVSSTSENFGIKQPSNGLGPKQIGVWSISERRWLSRVDLDQPTGSIMGWNDYVVGFYEYPRLIDLKSGKTVFAWEALSSGKQTGAILVSPLSPPIALDPQHGRFAVAGPGKVSVVSLLNS